MKYLILKRIIESSKLLLLLILLAGTFSYAMFQGGFVSWFLFYSFLPFGLYSVLVFFYPLADFTITRKVKSQDLKAGSQAIISISIKRNFPFPLFYLILEDQVSTSIFSSQEITQVKKLIHPWFKKTVELEYEIENLPRGEHVFSGLELKTGDFLGLFQKTVTLEKKDSILVYPSIVHMTYQPINVRFDQGVASSDVKIQRDTTMATGLREYQPGDRVSWIHWKSFARTNSLMTKEFEERKSHDVYMVLDCTPSISFEDMVTFSASLSKAVLKKGAQIGFYSSGEKKQQLPVRSGANHQRQLLYQLAKVQADSQEPLEQRLKKEVGSFQHSASLLVVTSQLTRPLLQQLHDFTKNNSAVAVFLVKGSNDRVTAEEQQLKAFGSSKGILIKECHAGHFSTIFAEVKRA